MKKKRNISFATSKFIKVKFITKKGKKVQFNKRKIRYTNPYTSKQSWDKRFGHSGTNKSSMRRNASRKSLKKRG